MFAVSAVDEDALDSQQFLALLVSEEYENALHVGPCSVQFVRHTAIDAAWK